MKILFVIASAEYLRYYDSTLRLLALRGHEVIIGVNHDSGGRKPVRLDDVEAGGTIRVLGLLPARAPWWNRVAVGVRGTMDFVRFLDPRLAHAHALRARIKRKVLPAPLHVLDRIPTLQPRTTRRVVRALMALEEAVPTVPALDALLRDLQPDAVVVSPLVDAASPQVDVVRSARRAGIPVAAAIASWDNLTNKGLIRIAPDRVFVWNDIQKREAVELHGIAEDAVVVTGAQLFDRWFDRQPSRGGEEFRRHVGLPGGGPFILFTGSSHFIAEGRVEVAFVRSWIRALRSSASAAVANAAILVRPHPYNAAAWAEADLSDLADVAVWPNRPFNPVDEEQRAGYFDSLYHSSAVVGINTSAMIEAAILGKAVLSIRAKEFAGTQEGTLHFHYLLPDQGGFLQVATTLDEHVSQMAVALANPEGARRETARFVAGFIRPHGVAVPATPILAGAIEQLGALPRVPRPVPAGGYALRAVAWAVAVAAAVADLLPRDEMYRARKSLRMRVHRARKTMARVTGTAVGR